MARPIGIVACSAEGAALCYRTICLEGPQVLGRPLAHPEVMLHGASFADYMDRIEADDWVGVSELMLDSARKLTGMGARLLICPDNTIHNALPYIQGRSPAPWLHIAEVVAAEAAARGYSRIGLTGTKWLVDSMVYPEKLSGHGLSYVRPLMEERDEINRIIMEELVRGVCTDAQVSYLQGAIERLKDKGCDAVVLGCTELPLILSDANSPLPTLDSTRLLARAALTWAAG